MQITRIYRADIMVGASGHYSRFHMVSVTSQKQLSIVFLQKGVLKICSKFKGEHPCQSVISIKLPCNFFEITLQHGCSPVNLLHIFRTLFPKNTSGGLLITSARPYLKKDLLNRIMKKKIIFLFKHLTRLCPVSTKWSNTGQTMVYKMVN